MSITTNLLPLGVSSERTASRGKTRAEEAPTIFGLTVPPPCLSLPPPHTSQRMELPSELVLKQVQEALLYAISQNYSVLFLSYVEKIMKVFERKSLLALRRGGACVRGRGLPLETNVLNEDGRRKNQEKNY
ncbi:hypothetical protein F7725_022455 [Dissostichus mawsoni]|uniref:Uncharacterized protein n=1 Tax=Dissostichus mawsoni TaxID=36200 RepID=A0A7J5YY64_DISMA|nr:hypothetical protein F7725_022455 [Dissostichus mawsoni]